jgi:hypothetical protein
MKIENFTDDKVKRKTISELGAKAPNEFSA